jgi:lysophospholipase L1-like esterase
LLHIKRAFWTVTPTVLVIVGLEIVLRFGAFFLNDFSQYYLFYGLHSLVGRVGVSPWSVYDGDHYKFPPNYLLQGAAGQGSETAATNSLGFRGPDFDPSKPPGTFRVITLGGSSTFGFHNTDTGTYPYQLQQRFREPIDGRRIEVINAGFPYYTTASIRSLLESELGAYDPDLLTLYTAYNDASWPLHVGTATRWLFWLQQHSIIYLAIKTVILPDQRVYKIQNELRKWWPMEVDTTALDTMAEAVAARYRRNIEAVLDFAVDRDVAVIVIRQPMTTRFQNDAVGEYTYEEDYRAVRAKIAAREVLGPFDVRMILHRRLIEELDRIASEHGLPVVDNIAIVDRHRSSLTTWVHLTEEANGRLADALHDAIVPLVEATTAPTS